MSSIESTLSFILSNHTSEIAHNAIFSRGGASFYCQIARGRRATLPRDAEDMRILIEYPAEEGRPGWELDVRVALRCGEIWNPKVHFEIAAARAEDTTDQQVILARVEEWTGQW